MDDKLPRRRFQIHLSTALVLMFAAAGLLFLNMNRFGNENFTEQQQEMLNYSYRHSQTTSAVPFQSHIFVRAVRGWPLVFQVQMVAETQLEGIWGEPRWNYWNLTADMGIALGMLGAIAWFCEWLIARRLKLAG